MLWKGWEEVVDGIWWKGGGGYGERVEIFLTFEWKRILGSFRFGGGFLGWRFDVAVRLSFIGCENWSSQTGCSDAILGNSSYGTNRAEMYHVPLGLLKFEIVVLNSRRKADRTCFGKGSEGIRKRGREISKKHGKDQKNIGGAQGSERGSFIR